MFLRVGVLEKGSNEGMQAATGWAKNAAQIVGGGRLEITWYDTVAGWPG